MGPKGGDELNIIEPGNNYGWPLVSWGDHYDGRLIPKPPTRPEFKDAIHHWSPAIAPSGMVFYSGDAFPEWRGDILIGGLISQSLFRLTLDGDQIVGEERIPMGSRIRDVRESPDGAVYLLTDQTDGKILRLTPEAGDDVSSRGRRRL
jgi:glucose/arabinose dehydrogenase